MKKSLIYILVFVMFVSCKQEEVSSELPKTNADVNEEAAGDEESVKLQKFYEQVLLGKREQALLTLNSIYLATDFEVKEPTYLNLFEEFSLGKAFYEDPKFNDLDYFYWAQSLLFKRLSEEVKSKLKEGEDPIKALYNLVNIQVKAKGDGPDRAAFPMQIWQRGFGVCDRQSWAMCELAYQLGADVYIIYFIEEDTGISKHTICQITYEGRDYLVDPLYQKFLPDFHWNDLTEGKAAEIWHDHVYLADDIKKAEILLPSMPHDFCVRQQVLAKKLKPLLSEDILFRFGESPRERAKRWPYKQGQDYFYWDYPHRLMTGMTAFRQLYPKNSTKK
ncbi:hypothetical protein PQO01_12475 [Lentisphaera marina]|uniref:hypothetical protein n=1 Tax=Lentisphaera marina TaxID=1111041 RepID=UPI00236537A5|nr:hypothetical protein [Lentisphaera marina]MDD7985767.1 hypothetical protein [Lentisphaera marina]